MNEFRTLLTIVSFASGILLIGWGVVRLSATRRTGKKQTGSLVLLYGTLFIIVSLVLYLRKDSGTSIEEPPVAARTPATTAQIEETLPVEQPVTSDIELEKPPEVVATRETASETQKRIAEQPSSQSKPVSKSATKPTRRKITQKSTDLAEASTPDTLPPEDRIYTAISRAFDTIELWFYENGYPASVGNSETVSNRNSNRVLQRQIQFPRIAFEAGTAELHPQSREALKDLAESLKQIHSPVSLEIQARVDSLGPEPFNYILTQARVEIVRVVLIQEGVDTHRLLATALGSQGEDSLKAGTQIRFVLRP